MEVTVHGKAFRPFLTHEIISERVAALAAVINTEYAGKLPLFIGILNGSFIFAADLFRNITIESEISFIKLASYKGTHSTGNVVTAIGLEEQLKDRHIILVEDIVDTGKTLYSFMPEILGRNPASVEIATLLCKPDALQYPVQAKYCAFEIENKFVLGYGLDYDGLGRNFRDLYVAV